MSDPRIRVTQLGDVTEEQLLQALDAPTIRICLPSAAIEAEHQLLAVALVDLLGRVFPRIDIRGDSEATACAALGPGPPRLSDRLQAARRHGAVDPLEAGEPTLTVAIGHEADADLYVDATDWTSYIGRGPSALVHPAAGLAPIGPLAAACRAAAHAFGTLLHELFPALELPDSAYASALSFETGTTATDEPELPRAGALRAVLVGAGSVGGAAAYALARAPELAGELIVVDPQTLADHNFDRAILATRDVVQAGLAKAKVAERALAHLSPMLQAVGVQATIGELLAAQPRTYALPLVLCAVDSAAARRSVQDCLPLELVNAACGPNEVQISGHLTDDGPCVCCLHMKDIMDAEQARARVIARVTRLPFKTVVGLLISEPPAPLDPMTLRGIERNTDRAPGSLNSYIGRTLDDLWREQLMYGGAAVESEGGTRAVVAAPWVTALAGVLLAGEALKAAIGSEADRWRLGPHATGGARYVENPYASPEFAQRTRPERWGSECLCRSPRRLRILSERYGLG